MKTLDNIFDKNKLYLSYFKDSCPKTFFTIIHILNTIFPIIIYPNNNFKYLFTLLLIILLKSTGFLNVNNIDKRYFRINNKWII